MEEELSKIEGLKRGLTIINFLLLAIHCALFFLFLSIGVRFMCLFNIASILVYFIGYFIIDKQRLLVYIIIALAEVMVHLCAATVCMGWEVGFALYILPLMFTAFYIRYVFHDMRMLGYTPEVASIASVILFIGLKFYSIFVPPVYEISKFLIEAMYITNCVIIFGFTITCMYFFTTSVVRREDSLHEMADFDDLTKLYNRHKMRDVLDEANTAATEGRSNFSTTILDIDDFKKINDTYGHDAGDYVLRTIAEIMRTQSYRAEHRKVNVGRWGGEEFLIVQEYDPSSDDGTKLCAQFVEDLLAEIRNHKFLYKETLFFITMTAGIAFHEKDQPIAATINKADNRLYYGKEHGKDTVVVS